MQSGHILSPGTGMFVLNSFREGGFGSEVLIICFKGVSLSSLNHHSMNWIMKTPPWTPPVSNCVNTCEKRLDDLKIKNSAGFEKKKLKTQIYKLYGSKLKHLLI